MYFCAVKVSSGLQPHKQWVWDVILPPQQQRVLEAVTVGGVSGVGMCFLSNCVHLTLFFAT